MKTKNAPAISISKKVYTMATTDESGSSAEITMYGDIYEQQPTNWWGEPIEGQYILLSEFLEDLKQISSCKNITIRMNSYELIGVIAAEKKLPALVNHNDAGRIDLDRIAGAHDDAAARHGDAIHNAGELCAAS